MLALAAAFSLVCVRRRTSEAASVRGASSPPDETLPLPDILRCISTAAAVVRRAPSRVTATSAGRTPPNAFSAESTSGVKPKMRQTMTPWPCSKMAWTCEANDRVSAKKTARGCGAAATGRVQPREFSRNGHRLAARRRDFDAGGREKQKSPRPRKPAALRGQRHRQDRAGEEPQEPADQQAADS